MPKDENKETDKGKNEDEGQLIRFFCKKCDIIFGFSDETPLDDIKCPECGTYEIFIEFEEEDGEIKI
ncbi:MAG: hypothetical protein ACTSRG_17160 [Candidatus Helarchaeota archaeon]